VVADGAGSASHSEVGATFVCDALVDAIAKCDSLEVGLETVRTLVEGVRQSLVKYAAHLDVELRQLASTLLLAVIYPDCCIFGQIGDGGIVVRSDQSSVYEVIFWPEPQEYVNCTNFITDETFGQHLVLERRESTILEVAVFTDGLQGLVLENSTRSAHNGFFSPLFSALSREDDMSTLGLHFKALLDSERINSRTDDDKTMVLALKT
jgi:hypothetical protein